MEESEEDAALREELIASIMESIEIINRNLGGSKKYDEEL